MTANRTRAGPGVVLRHGAAGRGQRAEWHDDALVLRVVRAHCHARTPRLALIAQPQALHRHSDVSVTTGRTAVPLLMTLGVRRAQVHARAHRPRRNGQHDGAAQRACGRQGAPPMPQLPLAAVGLQRPCPDGPRSARAQALLRRPQVRAAAAAAVRRVPPLLAARALRGELRILGRARRRAGASCGRGERAGGAAQRLDGRGHRERLPLGAVAPQRAALGAGQRGRGLRRPTAGCAAAGARV